MHSPSLQDLIPPTLPIISVSKGIEVTSGQLMSEVIPSVLGKKQPTVYLSGAPARLGALLLRMLRACRLRVGLGQ